MQHPGNLECFSFGTCMLEVGFLGYDQYNVDMSTSWWQPSLELNVERRLSEWSEVISAIVRIIHRDRNIMNTRVITRPARVKHPQRHLVGGKF